MPTDVFWNDADPAETVAEHMAAEWLVSVARSVGLTSVTAENESEWLWRWTFKQEMLGCRYSEYKELGEQLVAVLDRFRSVTLEGRVWDETRDEFITRYVAARVECCRDQAGGAAWQLCALD